MAIDSSVLVTLAGEHRDMVCAVIIIYHHNYDKLISLLAVTHSQVERIFLIDNNPWPSKSQHDQIMNLFHDCRIVANSANLGLAKALNQGIRCALAECFNYILLLDQDSKPAADMIEQLITAHRQLSADIGDVAAVGPCIYDQQRNSSLPFLKFKPAGVKKLSSENSDVRAVAVDFLVTSGCLIDAHILTTNTLMDETLFIDNVDLEWCFRLKKAGYALFGIPRARLFHQLGDGVTSLPFSKRPIALHNPKRQYFIMRNRLLLYHRKYVPIYWKIHDVPRLIFKLVFFSLFVPPRYINLTMMLKGLLDGMIGGNTRELQNRDSMTR